MDVKISDRARELLKGMKEAGKTPRIHAERTGCCGGYRAVILASEAKEGETTERIDGIDFLVDERVKPLLWRATIDYGRNGLFKDFIVKQA